MNLFKSRKEIIVVAVALAILFGLSIPLFIKNKKEAEEKENINNTIVEEEKNPFSDLILDAESAFIFDAKENKSLFGLNQEVQLPLASITKLMTALVSSEVTPQGAIVTIDDSDLGVDGDSGFSSGERWTFANILNFTLITSSNDGAHALASLADSVMSKGDGENFVDKMNTKAKEIGLTQTFFLNETGLDTNESFSGAYGSAKDVAILMSHIVKNKPEILEATKYSVLEINSKDKIYKATNTNQVVESIPGIIGSKTGFTDLAGGNLVVVFDAGINHPIVVSVLGSTKEGRFSDVRKLIQATINQFSEAN